MPDEWRPPTTTDDEGDNQMKCVLRDLACDITREKWVSGKWQSNHDDNEFTTVHDQNTWTVIRLRQVLFQDPNALHALFDMFASAVCSKPTVHSDPITATFRCLSLSEVTDVHSFDALKARVAATTADIPAPELIEHLLSKVDGGGGDGGLNFRSAPFPCVGPGLPQNSFAFAMGPKCNDDDDDDDGGGGGGGGGGHDGGLFVYVPVTSTMGAYGPLARWPTPPEVGVSDSLHAALGMARWTDSWGDASLFGVGRYRSVFVCRARRSTFHCQLPYKIGAPQYLLVCPEQTWAKNERRPEPQPGGHFWHVSDLLQWQPLVLGALVLVGRYMAYRYGVSAEAWLPTWHWPIAGFRQFAVKCCVSKPLPSR